MVNNELLIKENLKKFLVKMLEVEDSYEILTFIFEYHVNKEDVNFNEILEHVGRAFKFDPNSLLGYFLIDEDLEFNKLGLNQSTYRNAFKLVSKLKIKYSGVLKKASQKALDPFLLIGGEVNVKQNESTHRIMFERADGLKLDANFKPESLLPISILLTHGLMQSLKVGIFNLDEGMINHYLTVTEELNEFLRAKLESEKEKND